MAKYGTKNALFGYCWAIILKRFCPIVNQHPQICEISKFHKQKCLNLGRNMPYLVITKGPKFLRKNALFAYC